MYPDVSEVLVPSLPLWFLLPATALFALASAYWILRTEGRAARYLIFACAFRFIVGALHQFTYEEAFGGLRWVALGSLFTIALGLVVLEKRRIFSKIFIPVVLIVGVMIVSAIVNQSLALAIDPILRLLFFVLTAVALWQALETTGLVVLKRLLLVFIQPILFLVASLVLGVVKSGELDGSNSFIGGYRHEELFSLILVTCFLAAILAGGFDRWMRVSLIVGSFVGIYLTDYRTTMLAVLPLAATFVLLTVPRAFPSEQRAFVKIGVVVMGALLIYVGAVAGGSRFSDLASLGKGSALIRPPETFTYEDQRVLSARPYIWSQYIYAYADAPRLQQVIGHGPDSWEGRFPLYAHNTVVSFLYEVGALGVAALLFLWLMMARLAFGVARPDRQILIAGHASFFLLNMATMPHWQIEGNIFYGLLCGYTIAKARLARRLRLDRDASTRGHLSVTDLNRPEQPARAAGA